MIAPGDEFRLITGSGYRDRPVDELRPVTLTPEWRDEFISMAAEFQDAGDPVYDKPAAHFDEFLVQIANESHALELPPDHVPMGWYWLALGERLIGASRFRRRQTSALLAVDGHIGYEIRPSERGKGFATYLLSMMLDVARDFGRERVLLTCTADNKASLRVIEKNGGERFGSSVAPATGVIHHQYWISLTGSLL